MTKAWLIGSGKMAQDYIKVLNDLKISTNIIGRGKTSANNFEIKTGHPVIAGGLALYLKKNPAICSHAIVSVGVENLFDATKLLMEYGVKNILVEKPGALIEKEFEELVNLSRSKKANIFIAYNRRFYASVIKAKQIIENDGGITSFNFEFTEWGHVIAPLIKGSGVKEKWFLSNSTHVVDLAFNIGGLPKEISSFTHGSLDWHPSASLFCGAGISENGALFNYSANWESAGRWGVEILTKEHKLILRPIEKLKIQKRGTIAENFVEDIDYSLDDNFKPGLYLQTEKFLNNDFHNMCSIKEQNKMIKTYNKIANYN